MYHQLRTIASTHRFNEATFVNFAIANKLKYGVIVANDDLPGSQTSTWYTDDLVEEYKKQIDTIESRYLDSEVEHVTCTSITE